METIPEKLKEAVLLFEGTSCGIGLFQKETHETVFLNSAFCSITGYSQQEFSELIGSGNRELFYAKDKAALQRLLSADSSKQELRDFECRIICRNNEIKWVLFSLAETEAEDKKYYLASITDNTECKHNAEILEVISENTVASIAVFSMQDQTEKLIFVNDCFFKQTGIGRRMYEKYYHAYNDSLISKVDRERMQEEVMEVLKSGESKSLSYQVFLPNKKILWIESRISAVQVSPDTVWVVAVSLDSSEKKKRELDNAAEQKRYKLLINELNAAVYDWNCTDNTFFSSPKFNDYALSTLNKDSYLQMDTYYSMVHPDDREVMEQFGKSVKKNIRVEAVMRLKMKKGGYRWCRMVVLAYKDEKGRNLRTVGIITDINKECEKTFMLNSVLSQMPGGVTMFKVKNNEAICQYYTQGLPQMTGRTDEIMNAMIKRGTLLEEAVDSQDYQRLMSRIQWAAARKQKLNIIFRVNHVDGSSVWVQLNANMIREEEGCPVYYCIFTNPSREVELYRNITKEIENAIVVADIKQNTILYNNDMLNTYLGISEDAILIGRKMSELFNANNAFVSDADILNLTKDRYRTTYRIVNDKKYQIRAKLAQWNGIDAYIAVAVDVTSDYKRQIHLQELVDRIPGGVGVFRMNSNGRISVYLND